MDVSVTYWVGVVQIKKRTCFDGWMTSHRQVKARQLTHSYTSQLLVLAQLKTSYEFASSSAKRFSNPNTTSRRHRVKRYTFRYSLQRLSLHVLLLIPS
jgi:hypothetical protein